MSAGFSRINELAGGTIDRRYRSDIPSLSIPTAAVRRAVRRWAAGGGGNGPGDELGAAALRACGRQLDVLIAPDAW